MVAQAAAVVPALATEAYLRATVTNDSPLLLLPGPARVFHETQFVGETSLDTVAAGEEFELQLGVDDQIRVQRELRRRAASRRGPRATARLGPAWHVQARVRRQRGAVPRP